MKRIPIVMIAVLAAGVSLLRIAWPNGFTGAQGSAPPIGSGPEFEFPKSCPAVAGGGLEDQIYPTPDEEFARSIFVVRATLIKDEGLTTYKERLGAANAIPSTARMLKFRTTQTFKGDAPAEFELLEGEGDAIGRTWPHRDSKPGQEAILFLLKAESMSPRAKPNPYFIVSSTGWYTVVGDAVCARNSGQDMAFKYSMIPVPQTVDELFNRVRDGAKAAIAPTWVPAQMKPEPLGPATATVPAPTYDPNGVPPPDVATPMTQKAP